MDDHLQKLTRELRSEKCPPTVLARVRDQIAREPRPRNPRVAFAALVGAAVVLLVVFSVVPPRREHPPLALPASPEEIAAANTVRVAEETAMSLACIGQVMLAAGVHGEDVLRKAALPPLRSSWNTLQTTFKIPNGS